MKKFLSYMIVALAALWMAGCSDELGDQPADQPDRGIVIRLSTGDLETRTDLTSQANLQHVRKVYALLYDGTGDLVGSPELLMDVDKTSQAWDPTEGGSYNDINGEEFVLPQTKTAGLEAGDYTVLCVGLDDRSGETYGLTLDKMKTWTLKEARATLAAGKGVDDIAHSELFAGWAEFDFEPDNINIVEVMLKRRVAGVLCYVTDIPTTINTSGANKNKPVTKLRLALYTGEKPNNQISLCRKEVEKATDGTIKIPDDFGEYSEDAPKLDIENGYLVLKEVDLSEYSSDSDIFSIPEQDTENLKVKANSLLIGAYVIPTKATDGKVTLKVELLGEGDEVLATFNAKRDGTSGSESYNIYPNYIYHIGDKPESDSTEGDQPASLLGKELTVVPQEWTTMPVDVEFPSVPVKPRMELVNEYGEVYSNYIFDCIGSDKIAKLLVYNSIVKTNWKITVSSEGVYIWNGSTFSNSYIPTPIELDQSDPVELKIALTDYAKYNVDNNGDQIPPEDDIREITINLETSTDIIPLTIRQYNALVVNVNGQNRGFSRFDWGTKRSPINGLILENGNRYKWGYHTYANCVPSYIFDGGNDDYNGSVNYANAKRANKSEWHDSAIYNCASPGYVYDENSQDLKEIEANWYLPAYYELEGLVETAGEVKENGNERTFAAYNMKIYTGKGDFSNRYWSSTPVGGTALWSWSCGLLSNGDCDFNNDWSGGNDYNYRDQEYYMRQCCIIH